MSKQIAGVFVFLGLGLYGWAYGQSIDGFWAGTMTCSENLANRNPAYSIELDFQISDGSGQAERTDSHTVETFALRAHPAGEIQLQSTGRLRSETSPRWITRFSGKLSGEDKVQLNGQMFSGNGQTLVRERCSLSLIRTMPTSAKDNAKSRNLDKSTDLSTEGTTATGSITCSATATGQPEYTQPLRLRFIGHVANGVSDSSSSHEIQELVVGSDGSLRFSAGGVGKLDDSRWFIRGTGVMTGRTLRVNGKMYDSAKKVVRNTCAVWLEVNRDVQRQQVASGGSFPLETIGSPLELSASTLWGQRAFREWNFEFGMPWSFRARPSWSPRHVGSRPLKWTELALASDLRSLMQDLPIKAFVLVDAGQVVAALAKPGVTPSTLLPSASMSKNVTALGVGKAVCFGLLSLETKAAELIPALRGKETGDATLRQILLMSSGSAETETQHTSGVTFQETESYLQNELKSLEDLISDPRLSRLKSSGRTFDYKSYDPYLAALMVQRATGQKFTSWLQDTVFKDSGLEHGFVLDTDPHGNFLATAGVRLTLSDWVRLGVYIQEQRDRTGCFADFVREMLRPVISISKIPGINGHFNGYGLFTWTDADLAPDMGWLAGHFGQRIGISTRPGNSRVFLTFGDGTDFAMGRIYPLAKRWIH